MEQPGKRYSYTSVEISFEGKPFTPFAQIEPAPSMRRARRDHRRTVRAGLFIAFRTWARLKYDPRSARGKLAQVLAR